MNDPQDGNDAAIANVVEGSGPAPTTANASEPHAAPRNVAVAQKVAFAAALWYILYTLTVPLIRAPHWRGTAMTLFIILATIVTTATFMFLQLWLAKSLVALNAPIGRAVGAVVLWTAIWFLMFAFVHPYRHLGLTVNFAIFTLRTVGMGLALTVGLTYLGSVLSRIVREINVLLPVALIAMPIDYMGAMTPTGYTADMVKHHPHVVQSVSVSVPAIQGIPQIGFIGPGDVLFMAFFFAVVQNLKLNPAGTFRLMYLFLTATMLIVVSTGLNVAALVPMGLAVLIANFRYFKLQRSEVFASLYAMIIVFVVVVAFYVYSHHHFFGGK